jgi:hypothetical protein
MLDQMDIIDIYRVFYPTTMQCTFFSAAHENFSKIGNILGHKVSLHKLKKIEITTFIILDQNGIKQKKPQKIFKHMKTEQHTLNDQWVTKEIGE